MTPQPDEACCLQQLQLFCRICHGLYRLLFPQAREDSLYAEKGLGIAPAYSATKRFQNTYIDALEQMAHFSGKSICFTDIRPGFVATGLLNDGKHYPMLMNKEKVAKDIVKALKRKKRVIVIDWRYRILVAFWKLIPACIWRHLPVYN